MEFHELPESWQAKIRQLRRENGRYRTERNNALAGAAVLRVHLAALKAAGR